VEVTPLAHQVQEYGPMGVVQMTINGVKYGAVLPPYPKINNGAIEAILTHSNDTVFVGACNGGVWRTRDGGNHWEPLTDHMPSLSIRSLSYDTTDPTFRTIIAGVGPSSNWGGAGGPAAGVYITEDEGDTWTAPAAAYFDKEDLKVVGAYKYGPKIVAGLFDNKYVKSALYFSNDTGVTWWYVGPDGGYCTSMTRLEGTGTLLAIIIDTKAEPGKGQMWMSVDEGETWNQMPNYVGQTNQGWTAISATAASPTALYVIAIVAPYVQNLQVCSPVTLNCNFVLVTLPEPPTGSGTGHTLAVLADPNKSDRAYFGKTGRSFVMDGLDFATGSIASWHGYGGDVTDTNDTSNSHSDGRVMVIDSNGDLLEGSDGGIWKRTLPWSQQGVFLNMNGDMRVTECVFGDYDPRLDVAACGAQDNGVSMGRRLHQWPKMMNNDGAAVRFHHAYPYRMFASYQALGDFRFFNTTVFPFETQQRQSGVPMLNVQSLRNPPYEPIGLYNNVEINQFTNVSILIQSGTSIWEVIEDNPPVILGTFGCASNAVYGGITDGVPNPGLIWSSNCSTVLLRKDSSSALTRTNWPTIPYVPVGVAIDPTDGWTLYVAAERNVYKTSNAGKNYTNLFGPIPTKDNAKAIAVIKSSRNTNIIYTGARWGLFWAEDLGSKLNWTRVDMPIVLINRLEAIQDSNVVVVTTVGRGIWVIKNAGLVGISNTPSPSLSISPSRSFTASTTTTPSVTSTAEQMSPIINNSPPATPTRSSVIRSDSPPRESSKRTPTHTKTKHQHASPTPKAYRTRNSDSWAVGLSASACLFGFVLAAATFFSFFH